MNIVITGSHGYIGRVVTDRIKRERPNANIILIDQKIGLDIADVKGLRGDVLIHLAAHVQVVESYTEADSYYHNNCAKYHQFLNHNNNLFDRVIYASSGSVYNDKGQVNPESVYGSTKLECEFINNRFTNNSVSLRFANPVGVFPELHSDLVEFIRGRYPSLHWILAECAVKNKTAQIHDIPGMIRDFYPVAWIGECINALIDRHDITGPRDLGSGIPTPVIPLIGTMAAEYDIQCEFVQPPAGTSKGFENRQAYEWLDGIIAGFRDYDPEEYCREQLENYITLVDQFENKQ